MIKSIIKKSQLLYFNCGMRLRGMLRLPAQTRKEIRIFKTVLDGLTAKPLRIFEWGSGFSTIFYAEYLRRKKADFTWHSIDNNASWHRKVTSMVEKKALDDQVKLHLREFAPFWEKPGWKEVPPPCGLFGPASEEEKDYISFPKVLGGPFDLIVVDARFRRHCLRTAREVVSPEGIVMLHDAQKTHYHNGLSDFEYGRFLESGSWYPFQSPPNRVWIGSMENKALVERPMSLG